MTRSERNGPGPHRKPAWWGDRVHVVLGGWCIWFQRWQFDPPEYDAGWWSPLSPNDCAVTFHGETAADACRAAIRGIERPYGRR